MVKKTLFILLYIFLCNEASSQIAFRTRYKSAFYIEGLGTSPFFSIGLEHAPVRHMKDFTTMRIGVGGIFGNTGATLLKDAALTIPMSVTKSYVVNNLKKRAKYRVSLRCKAVPPKVATEWFFEIGGGYTPVISKADVRHRIYGIIALRQQLIIDIPPKPKVFYLKVQYNPYFSSYKAENASHFNIIPTNSSAILVGASLGFSFK